ncbi:phage baseplate assembly protein V [Candidatus Kuenenia sp.]|uniref:phage baseplate assembly protein V n=1 Tax=Candidatus Kuenenia sp. TaxID=2499824 RepID=UPI00321FE9E3
MNLEKIVANLVQKIEYRFYGKYRGFVVNNADPEQLGRLKVKVPSVLGNDVVTGWAVPCVPYGGDANLGSLFIPEVDAGVWVEFEEGDLEFPIWVGTFWSKPGGESELPKPNKADGSEESGVQDPPTRKIIKTKKGHTIQFEDADGDEMVIVVEATNSHVIKMDKDGIKITDGAKNEIKMDSQGIVCKDKNNNVITMDSSSITIKSNKIKIGEDAAEPLVLGTQLKTALSNWVNTVFAVHMHTGNLGAPTTPPLPGAPLLLDPALSKKHAVE